MVRRTARTGALVLALVIALVTAGCSSDGGGEAAPPAVDPADDETVQEVAAAADRYVGQLGGEGAFAAVIIALDRGYSTSQLLATDALLSADGTIEGVDPDGEPVGATTATAEATVDGGSAGAEDEEGAWGAPSVRLASLASTEVAQSDDVDPTEVGLLGLELTLGDAHERAIEAAYLSEVFGIEILDGASAEDVRLLFTILALSSRGYDVDQIVLGLATGTFEANPPPCPFIQGELPARDTDTFDRICPEILVDGASGSSGDDEGSGADSPDDADSSDDASSGGDDGTSDEGGTSGGDTALTSIAPGTYQGTIDTTGAFRSGVTVTAADITLTVSDGEAAVDWTVEWSEDAGECTTMGTDYFSSSEVTQDTATSFSVRGTRSFRPSQASTCDLSAEPSDFERTLRLDVDGSTVTADVGVGIATIDVAS